MIMFVREINKEMIKDKTVFFLLETWAADSPYTIPKDAPSNKKVIKNVIIFFFIISPFVRPKFVQTIS